MLTTILLISVVLVALLIFRIFVYPRYKYAEVDKIPGPPKHWLNGTIIRAPPGRGNLDQHLKNSLTYGGIARMWAGPFFPFIVVYHPKQGSQILKSSHPKASLYDFTRPWLGIGLLTAAGEEWKRKRRMITPAFHFGILKKYQAVFVKHIRVLFEKWDRAAETHEPVDIADAITHLTLDIIGECAFSCDIGAQRQGRRSQYVNAIYEASDLVYARTFKPLHANDWIYYNLTSEGKRFKAVCEMIHSLPNKVIVERRAALEARCKAEGFDTINDLLESTDQKLDFLDILLCSTGADGNPLPYQEILDEVNTFMFEGHDTTSAGLLWSMYLISTHADVEAKVVSEIREAFGDSDECTTETFTNLKYTKAALDEALRLYPPVPVIARKMDEDTEVDGYILPKGIDVIVHPFIMHRQPDVWENPEEFRPERFTKENRIRREGYFDYVPFSAGPRNCIGQRFALQEEQTIISMVFNRYHLDIVPGQKIEVMPTVVSRSLNGIKAYVSLRK